MAAYDKFLPPQAIPPERPYFVFAFCVVYLLDHGWYRDGDDLGIWRIQTPVGAASYTFGEALSLQLGRDGVKMTDAILTPSGAL